MTGPLAWLGKHKDAAIVLVIIVGIQGAGWVMNARTQAEQRRQGEMIERQLCLAVNRQVALQPPSGNPVNNPSRAFLQGEHQTWTVVGRSLGCFR